MRKSSGFSLALYIGYLICGIGSAVYCYLAAQNAEGWDGLGYAVLLILGLGVAAVGLVAFVFKLLHMATGWGLFGFLCMLLDLGVIAACVFLTADGGLDSSAIVLFGLPIVFSVGSFISNIKSLGR